MPQLCDAARAEGFRMLHRLVTGFESGDNEFTHPGEGLFGATRDGMLVGIAGLNVDPYFEEPGVGRVRHLYVHPAHRRGGVGRKLTAAIERAARGHFERLQLFTPAESASRFYEALGFEPVSGIEKVSHAKALGS
jgi:GNAT superfamily N-acetyltransferase